MQQQLLCFQLHLIQEASFIRAHIIGAYGNAKFLSQRLRKVANAVRCNHNGQTLCLLKDQDILSNLRQLRFLCQIHQLLGQKAQHRRLKKGAAYRLCQIAAKALLPVKKLIVASRIGRKGNDRGALAQTSRLCAQFVETLDSIHTRHQMIHQNHIVMLFLGLSETFCTA